MSSAEPPSNPYIVRAFEDSAALAAHTQGRKHAVYDLLCARRDASRDPDERRALDEFLRYRRNFVVPGTPGGMGSINGVGVKLYGQSELDPSDGTFIATLYVIVVFVPVFPLAEYLVRRASSGMIRSSWNIFGKVPLGRTNRIWRKASVGLVAFGAVALVAAAAIASYQKRQSADVYITNDLAVAFDVSVGKSTVEVCPHCQTPLRKVPKGPKHVVVTRKDGRVIEEEDVTIRGGAGATIINVLGASPVFEETVFYATGGNAPDSEPRLFPGERFIVIDSADYVFVEPPKTIKLSNSAQTKSKTHVGRADEGVDVTIGYLAQNDPTKLAELLRNLAVAEPESQSMTLRALDTFDQPADQLAFAERMIALEPGNLDLHRRRQNLMVLLGRTEKAIGEYKARYEADTSNAGNAYLYAAVLPRGQGRLVLEKAISLEPENPYVLRLLGAIAYQERRFKDAVTLLSKLESDPPHHKVVLSEHAASLVATEGPLAAIQMLNRLRKEEKDEPLYWVVYGQVVERARRVAGATDLDPTTPVPKTTTPDDWAMLYAQWGVRAPTKVQLDVASRSAGEINLATRLDPTHAIELFDQAAPQARSKILATTALCLAVEAARLGNQSVARAAYSVAEQTFGKDPPLEAFAVEGRDDEALDGEPLAVRAIVELGRSRREKDKKKRDALASLAALDDPLLGLVPDAVQAWPAP